MGRCLDLPHTTQSELRRDMRSPRRFERRNESAIASDPRMRNSSFCHPAATLATLNVIILEHHCVVEWHEYTCECGPLPSGGMKNGADSRSGSGRRLTAGWRTRQNIVAPPNVRTLNLRNNGIHPRADLARHRPMAALTVIYHYMECNGGTSQFVRQIFSSCVDCVVVQ